MKKIIVLLVMFGLLASSSLAMGISGIGVSSTIPFIRLAIDSDRTLDLGASYNVTPATALIPAFNTTTALARYNSNFMNLGSTDVHWGVALTYSSLSTNTSSMTLDLNVGAETKLNSNVAL